MRSRPRLQIAAAAAIMIPAVSVVMIVAPGVVQAAAATVTCDDLPAGGAISGGRLDSFTAVAPERLVDTRDGTGGVSAPLGAGCTLRLDLDETSVPANANAVSLSVTAISAQAGFLTVHPCATGRPATSNVNTRPGFPTPNLAIGTPDVNREICVYTLFATDLLVDLAGWWSPGPDRFRSIEPFRAVDTRVADPAPVPPNTPRAVTIVGGDVPADATAASVNLTVTETAGDGFLVAYPCGGDIPLASNVNFRRGETRAVAAIVGLGPDGDVCVSSNVAMHAIVDVNGFYAPAPQHGPAAALRPLAGSRIASSRDGIGGWTSPFAPDTIRALDPVAALADASQATAVTLNVTALNAGAPGFATLFPCGDDLPLVSSVNFFPGSVATNLVTVDLASDRTVCFYTSTGVDLIVDLFGVMTAPAGSLAERMSLDSFTWPPFNPANTDYVVECGADGSATLDLEPVSLTTARVNGLAVPPGALEIDMAPDQLVTIDLRRGAERSTYHFRCLPTEFPRLDISRPGEPAPGWYLTSLTAPLPGPPGFANFTVILNHYGAPVWYKRTDRGVIDVKRRADGRIIYTPQLGNAYGIDPTRGYRVTSLAGTLIEEHFTVDPVNFPVDHHDYVSLPDGGRAMLTFPLVRNQNLTVLGPGYFANDSIAEVWVHEINAQGQLVWDFKVGDHFGYRESQFPVRFGLFPNEPNGGEVGIWHINSLDRVNDGSGDYVLSSRHLDAVFRVDRATETVDWILGSLPSDPAAPGYIPNKSNAPRLRIVNDPFNGVRRPHDARLNGDVLTVFDNRTAMGQPARAVAYRIDAVAGTATMLWQIQNPTGLSSPGLGVNRVGPDGSVLVDWGGGLQPMFQEFTAAGVPMMTIAQVGGGASYRIVKEPITAFTAAQLRATAGGAVEAPA